MDLIKTLLVYMMVMVSGAVEAAPAVTPPPAALPTATPALITPAPVTLAPTLIPTLAPTATPTRYTTLYVGDRGEAVRKLQRRLTELKYLNDKIDGVYGKNTKKAVERFQYYNSLTVDGIAGPATLTLLYESTAVVTAPPEITEAPTPTAAPTVNVPVYYVDQNGRLLYQMNIACYGSTTIYANSAFISDSYVLDSSGAVSVRIYNGAAMPASVTFRYRLKETEAPGPATTRIAVLYLTEAGVTLPVKMVMPYNPVSNGWAEEVQVVKQQLEALLGTDYINLTIEAGPTSGFLSAVRRSAKYQFMKLNNGGSYADPTAWILAFQAGNNWTFLDQVTTPNVQALQKEYQALLDEAATHTGKDEARYAAYAKAEAFLLEHALVIPFSTDTWGNTVGRVNPFEQVPDQSGRYKYMHVLSEPLTAEQFTTLYAEWKEACVTNAPEVQ